MMGVTSGIPRRSKKDVEGALLRCLIYRPAARVAAIFDIILVILCTAYVAFGVIRIIANGTVERGCLLDEDKVDLFFNFGNRSDSPVDSVHQCKRPRAEGKYSIILCTLLLCYIMAMILPFYAAFGLLQSTTELSDMDLKTKLMHVRFWIGYSLATLLASMMVIFRIGFPQCEVAIIGIAVFRLLFVFFVRMYADEMKEAVEQVEEAYGFNP